MKKILENFYQDSCWNKAKFDEYVFVLIEKDCCAPDAIEYWCYLRIFSGKNKFEDEQIQSALSCALQMRLKHEASNFAIKNYEELESKFANK